MKVGTKLKKTLERKIFGLGVAYSNMFQSELMIGRLESDISDTQRKFHYNVYKANKAIFKQHQRDLFFIVDLLHAKRDKIKKELKSKISFLNILYSNKFESDLTFSRIVDPLEGVIEFHKKVYESQEKVYNEQFNEIKKLIKEL